MALKPERVGAKVSGSVKSGVQLPFQGLLHAHTHTTLSRPPQFNGH